MHLTPGPIKVLCGHNIFKFLLSNSLCEWSLAGPFQLFCGKSAHTLPNSDLFQNLVALFFLSVHTNKYLLRFDIPCLGQFKLYFCDSSLLIVCQLFTYRSCNQKDAKPVAQFLCKVKRLTLQSFLKLCSNFVVVCSQPMILAEFLVFKCLYFKLK